MGIANIIKYTEIRIDQLTEELNKNSSNNNDLILGKAIAELGIVLDYCKREQYDTRSKTTGAG